MSQITLLSLLLAFGTMGCVSSRETVYREVERLRVEFENDTAARVFYETISTSASLRQRNEKRTSVNIPVILHHQRTEVDSENVSFNTAVRRCDTNGDGRITESEARIFAAQQK